jgi:hypothetical protein
MNKMIEIRAFNVPDRPDPGTEESTFRAMLEALRRRKRELDARHAGDTEEPK